MSLRQDFTHLTELATRLEQATFTTDAYGTTLSSRIYLSMQGHPKAAAWDGGPRSDTAFCWRHERDVSVCHEAGDVCFGDPMSGPSDPTGEAALRADRAADDERLYRDHIKGALRLLRLAEDIAVRYPPTRKPNAYEQELTAGNEPQCELCARYRDSRNKPYWSAPMLNGSQQPYRTTRGDVLSEPMYLCRTCDGHIARKGVAPNEQETRDHHEKGKMVCHHPDKAEAAA